MNDFIPLLKLAAELGEIHARSAAGSITVVPVIVEDLPSALPVLRSFCEIADGVLFEAADSRLQVPITGTKDETRRLAVGASLAELPGRNRQVELHDLPDGMIDARFEGQQEGGDLSPGERALLGLVRAVVHHDLDTHTLGVIAYRDSAIDFPFKRSIWNLAVGQLNGMPSPALRTLVFVAEAAISVDMHCQRAKGFRLAVDSDRLLRRHTDDDLVAWSTRIANKPQPVVLFLGAGFSVSSRLPLGNSLRDKAVRRLLGLSELDPMTSEQLCNRFYDWVVEKPWMTESERAMSRQDYVRQLTLEQVIRIEQKVYDSSPTLADFRELHDKVINTPGPAVLELVEILRNANNKLIIVEVNFDMFVETYSPLPLRVFSSDGEFSDAAEYIRDYLGGSEDSVPLLKLHGSIDKPETCIVSEEQTEAGITNGKLSAIRALYTNNPPRLWIYVGASMRDRDLLRVFGDADFGRGTEEIWVSPYLVDTVEEYARRRWAIWKGRELHTIDERLISETADSFMAALRSAWPVPGQI